MIASRKRFRNMYQFLFPVVRHTCFLERSQGIFQVIADMCFRNMPYIQLIVKIRHIFYFGIGVGSFSRK